MLSAMHQAGLIFSLAFCSSPLTEVYFLRCSFRCQQVARFRPLSIDFPRLIYISDTSSLLSVRIFFRVSTKWKNGTISYRPSINYRTEVQNNYGDNRRWMGETARVDRRNR